MSDIHEITKVLVDFRDARDWKQFHDTKNIVKAISIEAAELNEQGFNSVPLPYMAERLWWDFFQSDSQGNLGS